MSRQVQPNFSSVVVRSLQVGDENAEVSFSPGCLVAGIVFHLLEEEIAREVMADSIARTVQRLEKRGVRPSVRRKQWLSYTNAQRLEWLLAQSKTVAVLLSGRIATLNAGDKVA